MDSGATTYNDVIRNYHSTINILMRPIKRKKIIQNVLIKAKENRQSYMNIKKIIDSYKSYKRYSRKESIKKIFNIYSIKNN